LKIKNVQRKLVDKPIKANIKRAIERRESRNKNVQFYDGQDSHVQIIPTPFSPENSRYHQGMTDHVARNKAIDANKTGDDGLLTDN
jgi:hypothetical protein